MSKFYYKEKVIGLGTFGKVWLVKSKISSNCFVMKEVDLASMNSQETQQALTEVTVLSRCRHRNIIKYKDAVIDHKNEMLSIIMEYADGGDLYTAIQKQRGVPFKEHTVITWFTEICLALQYIHHKSIIHRDLKTRNVFLTSEGQIKVGDFGIARCLMDTDELAITAIGTPYYLSPEICDRKPYNHKSDMWAVGCILFEMAALTHPFQALNFSHLLSLIITGRRKDLPSYCSSLIKDLVDKLLDNNPETRPSADDVLAIPSLQPYLSEMWIIQNTNNATSLSRMLKQKVDGRHHSVNDVDSDSTGLHGKRRASISTAETRGTKTRFGFVSKEKSLQSSKLPTSTRSHSVKVYKYSPKRCTLKKEQFLTYKVLNPVTFKEKLTNIVCNGLKISRRDSRKAKLSIGTRERHDDSDYGYQSEEHPKCISDINFDSGHEASIKQPKTSTAKQIDISNFQVDDSFVEDVFDVKIDERQENANYPQTVKDIHSGCHHSQCQQCMLDILWKNRIRGKIGTMVKTNDRSELIRKLKAVFGDYFFDTVYHALLSNWENNENADTPIYLKGITNSMNYSQLQHLPLMMQLIQLDLIPK